MAAGKALKKPLSVPTHSDATLASGTVGVQQQSLSHKRKHKPTDFFGSRIGGHGTHVIASSNTASLGFGTAQCDTEVRTEYVLPVTSPVSHLTQTSFTTHSVQYTLSVHILSSPHSVLMLHSSS